MLPCTTCACDSVSACVFSTYDAVHACVLLCMSTMCVLATQAVCGGNKATWLSVVESIKTNNAADLLLLALLVDKDMTGAWTDALCLFMWQHDLHKVKGAHMHTHLHTHRPTDTLSGQCLASALRLSIRCGSSRQELPLWTFGGTWAIITSCMYTYHFSHANLHC